MPQKKPAPPGHVDLTSDEVEWLYAHLRLACKVNQQMGRTCDQGDALHRSLDKLDRARFPDGVPVLTPWSGKVSKAVEKVLGLAPGKKGG